MATGAMPGVGLVAGSGAGRVDGSRPGAAELGGPGGGGEVRPGVGRVPVMSITHNLGVFLFGAYPDFLRGLNSHWESCAQNVTFSTVARLICAELCEWTRTVLILGLACLWPVGVRCR